MRPRPQLGVSAGLSERAAALYPQTLTLPRPARRGRTPSAASRRRSCCAGHRPAPSPRRAPSAADPDELKIRTPVQIQQGDDDATVFKAFTDQLAAGYSAAGERLTYKTYPGVDHGGVVTKARAASDATSYIR